MMLNKTKEKPQNWTATTLNREYIRKIQKETAGKQDKMLNVVWAWPVCDERT